MNNPLNNLKNAAQQIRLSPEEKRAMHARVMAAVKATSGARGGAVKSPFYFFPQYSLALAAFVVVFFGGTLAAAQGALPGSLLYPLKTNVTEPAQGLLAFSTDAQAQYHANLAGTRLEEAEALASQGKLDATTSAELATSLQSQITQVQALNQTLAQSDVAGAQENAAQFDAALQAHGTILASLGEQSSNAQTQESSGALAVLAGSSGGERTRTFAAAKAAAVMPSAAQEPRVMAVMMAPAASSAPATSSGATSTPPASEEASPQRHEEGAGMSSRAQATYQRAQQQFDALKAALDATTSAKVEAQLSDIAAKLSSGDTLGALQASVRLSTFLSAGERFSNALLPSLLQNSDGGVDSQDE